MKKISFSERYGMQQAVLDGTKTMTRRIVPDGTLRMAQMEVDIHGGDLADRIKDHSFYLWRDEVAVAQCYEECWKFYQQQWESRKDPSDWRTPDAILGDQVGLTPGWKNKMFVKAGLMPHRIRITDIRVERLQDISREDCMREGIYDDLEGGRTIGYPIGVPFYYTFVGALSKKTKKQLYWTTAKEAFSVLIDVISGKGTWQRNPWVYVYEFELIK